MTSKLNGASKRSRSGKAKTRNRRECHALTVPRPGQERSRIPQIFAPERIPLRRQEPSSDDSGNGAAARTSMARAWRNAPPHAGTSRRDLAGGMRREAIGGRTSEASVKAEGRKGGGAGRRRRESIGGYGAEAIGTSRPPCGSSVWMNLLRSSR